MNIVEALADPGLFGALPVFHDLATWRPWLAFLRAFYGLPMDGEDLALFARHTGRHAPRAGGYLEAVVVVGVQSGKSRIAATVAAFEAAQASVRGDAGVYVPLIAQDTRGAQRALFGYVGEACGVPALAGETKRVTSDVLEFKGRVTVAVYPCRPQAVRGIRAAMAIVDELAFFRSSEGYPTDTEMLRAVRPRLLTTGGKLLILSSPYAQAGELWELHRRHYGDEGSRVLVWSAASHEMNPTLSADHLEHLREVDPEGYRSEIVGEFRAGLSTLFDPDAIDDCVVTDCKGRAPVPGVYYRAFADPSGGRADAFTLAIGHRGGERVMIDFLEAWPAPFNPTGVVAEAAGRLRDYGCHVVTGDRYGGEWPREAFRAHGITYQVAEEDRSELYLAMLPVVNAKAVELLDVPGLLRELRGLERRRGHAGRDRVDHRRGAHDDQANAVAGVVALLRNALPIVTAVGASLLDLRADYEPHREERARAPLFGRRRARLAS